MVTSMATTLLMQAVAVAGEKTVAILHRDMHPLAEEFLD